MILAAAAEQVVQKVATATVVPTWHDTLVVWTVDVCALFIVAGMILCIIRLLRGPHLADRALAVDTIAIQLIGLVILLSIRIRTLTFFDGILVLSLLGFAGTIAMAQYIGRPHLKRLAQTDADDLPADTHTQPQSEA